MFARFTTHHEPLLGVFLLGTVSVEWPHSLGWRMDFFLSPAFRSKTITTVSTDLTSLTFVKARSVLIRWTHKEALSMLIRYFDTMIAHLIDCTNYLSFTWSFKVTACLNFFNHYCNTLFTQHQSLSLDVDLPSTKAAIKLEVTSAPSWIASGDLSAGTWRNAAFPILDLWFRYTSASEA